MTKAKPQPEAQHAEPEGPDGGYGWVMVGAMFVSYMLVFGVIRSLGVFFVEFVEYFEESAQAISWISSTGLAAVQFFSPLATALCNAYGARPVVMAGGCLTGLGLILASQAKCLIHLYLTMGVITGLGWSLVFTPMMATVMRCFTRKRSLALSLGSTGSGIACFVATPLFQLLVDTYTWRGSLLILGGLSLNLVACGALIRPLGGSKVVAQAKTDSRSSSSAFLWKVYSYLELSLLFERPFVTYCVAVTLLNTGYFIPYIHLVAHARQVGLSEYQAAFVISATGITDIVGRIVSGWSADLGKMRLIHWHTLWTCLTGTFIVMLPMATLGGSYAGLVVSSLAYGFCAAALSPIIITVVPQIIGMDRMVGGLGLLMIIESIGALLGAPLSGFLKDYTGSYLASFVIAGCSLILGALVITTLPHFFYRTDPPPPRKCSTDSKKEAESSASGLMDNPAPNPDKPDPLETISYSETLPNCAETVPHQNHSLCSKTKAGDEELM